MQCNLCNFFYYKTANRTTPCDVVQCGALLLAVRCGYAILRAVLVRLWCGYAILRAVLVRFMLFIQFGEHP